MKITFKHISQKILLILSMFLLLNTVYAQSIIFSSDQWPKRWERAMHHQPMNGHMVDEKIRKNNFRKVSHREKSHQGWGQRRNEKRYSRSRTPEYNYRENGHNQRSQINNGSYLGYGAAPNPASEYYGRQFSAYPNVYQGVYPGSYSGLGFPGYGIPRYGNPGYGIPGYGVPGYGISGPGLAYPSPLHMAPGIFPGSAYPW